MLNATRIFFDRKYKYSAQVINISQDKDQLSNSTESDRNIYEKANI